MKQKLLFITALHILLSDTASASISASIGLKNFQNAVSSGKPAAQICAKANTFKGIFSVRSYDGSICKIPLVAAFAEAICTGHSTSYKESQCHKNAASILGTMDAQVFLKQEINKLSPNDKKAFCQKALDVSPFFASACNSQETNNQKQTSNQKKFSSTEIEEALKFFGLKPDVAAVHIKQRYQELTKRYHPTYALSGSKEASNENFKKLTHHYEVLQQYKPGSY